MKILVFSDIHGSVSGADSAIQIFNREKPDKTVLCGDVYDGWTGGNKNYIAKKLGEITSPFYVVKGNNDYSGDQDFSPFHFVDNAVIRAFGRTLFFTHGHVYNSTKIPPILAQGDVLVYGHTHTGELFRLHGIYIANVGSLSQPRGGTKNYLIIKENGVYLKTLQGTQMSFLPFLE